MTSGGGVEGNDRGDEKKMMTTMVVATNEIIDNSGGGDVADESDWSEARSGAFGDEEMNFKHWESRRICRVCDKKC